MIKYEIKYNDHERTPLSLSISFRIISSSEGFYSLLSLFSILVVLEKIENVRMSLCRFLRP